MGQIRKSKQRKADKAAVDVEKNQTRYLRDRAKETHSLSNRDLQNLVDPTAPEEIKGGLGFIGQFIIAAILAIIIMSVLFYLTGTISAL
jgi:hypothetical protein